MDEVSEDFAVLRTIVEAFDDPERYKMSLDEIEVASGIEPDGVRRALRRLWEADTPYIKGTGTSSTSYPIDITGVTERARVVVGAMPLADEFVNRLIAALEEVAEGADEEERSRLRRIAQGLGGMAREVVVRVAADLIARLPGSL